MSPSDAWNVRISLEACSVINIDNTPSLPRAKCMPRAHAQMMSPITKKRKRSVKLNKTH